MNILALDDSPYILEMLEMVITTINKTPILADLPSIALKVLETQKVDLIISDINMPEMTGIQFGHLLREKKIFIPIIYYSSEVGAKKAYSKELEKIGKSILIDKDAPIEKLINTIHQYSSKN